MIELIKTKSFEKDFKKLSKKHYNFEVFKSVLKQLVERQELSNKYKDHFLKGDKQGLKECHIENNIILIYRILDNQLILYRIGNHKDLLNK